MPVLFPKLSYWLMHGLKRLPCIHGTVQGVHANTYKCMAGATQETGRDQTIVCRYMIAQYRRHESNARDRQGSDPCVQIQGCHYTRHEGNATPPPALMLSMSLMKCTCSLLQDIRQGALGAQAGELLTAEGIQF